MESVRHLAAHLGLDLLAVGLLTFAIYHPRHRRRDLVPAYLALNVALFAVVAALAEVGTGGTALGFGLFGVLSIIRLRSDAVQHEEVAYYFSTLVLGLLCGLPDLNLWLAAALSAVLLAVVYVADHPRLYPRSRRTLVTLDAVHADPAALRADLARRLGEPLNWTVMEIDYVRDLMVVDVRYREFPPGALPGQPAPVTDAQRRGTGAHTWETV
ncbi:DUF4956 domain-containing protein [Streptomyces sp. AV19]|uniref:DUF4956 domain-containing protein n=1 Tax=Streptomyces sp. AV19 TaxID=2793068 RepID=UPI0018FEDF8C|nr:DUF4956 domain-containing protein [Streptomyces sp. AV19]MBH1936923.1 DUF4956 domain-containing protein [Streptomyces sp. AV19]MDG4532966.1 DUF4956 domain-containing protein [Streptomyces sp. AV19]